MEEAKDVVVDAVGDMKDVGLAGMKNEVVLEDDVNPTLEAGVATADAGVEVTDAGVGDVDVAAVAGDEGGFSDLDLQESATYEHDNRSDGLADRQTK